MIKGFKAYIDYANEKKLVPDHDISVTFGDDQYDPALTPGVINAALDGGAQVISEIIGTPQNLAVRSTLNEECVPQLEASSGDPGVRRRGQVPVDDGRQPALRRRVEDLRPARGE